MSDQKDDDQYSDEEAARRATQALRRSLTPPRPQKEMVGKMTRAKSPRARKPKSAPED